jgi:hypothetical protein
MRNWCGDTLETQLQILSATFVSCFLHAGVKYKITKKWQGIMFRFVIIFEKFIIENKFLDQKCLFHGV